MKTVIYSFPSDFVDFALSSVTWLAKSQPLALGLVLVFGKVRRYANQIFIKTIDPMTQGTSE